MSREEMFNKFLEVMNRFAQIKAIVAVKDGFIMTTPFTICGSLFLLVACLPIPGWNELMSGLFGENWAAPLFAVCGATFVGERIVGLKVELLPIAYTVCAGGTAFLC